MNATEIARVAYEVNRAYCEAMGDTSQLSWEAAPDWQRNSAIAGVHFHIDNPDATPEQSHEKWLEQKRADGWRYGPVKDPGLREHPCMVEYSALPLEQRAKDYLFRAVVHALKGRTVDITASDLTEGWCRGFVRGAKEWGEPGDYADVYARARSRVPSVKSMLEPVD